LTPQLATLQQTSALNLFGESGAGKTYQLVELARQQNGFYIAGQGYDRHLLASVVVNAVRGRLGLTPEYFISPEESFAAFLALWNDEDVPTLLYLDDVDDELFLSRVLREGKTLSSSRALVTTSSTATLRKGFKDIELGKVDQGLARQYLEHCQTGGVFSAAMVEQQTSFGNPLFLQYLCSYRHFRSAESVREIDTQVFGGLREDVQELISYVALSDDNLQLSEASLSTGWKLKTVLQTSTLGSHFLRQTEVGFELQHSHQKEVVRSVLEQQPMRRKYLQRRLARALNRRQSPLRAFRLLEAFGDPEALRFAPAALFEAGVGGDNKAILQITKRRLAAEKNLDAADEVALLLSKSMAERQAGADSDSVVTLEQAKTVAKESGLRELTREVRFLELYEGVYRSLRQEDLLELEAIVNSVDRAQDPFIRGRYVVDLSALYMHLNEHEKAVEHAREALELFRLVEDEYGEMTAKKNLVTALTKGDGEPLEIEKLSKELEAYRIEIDSVRDRAWFCNLRTRQCRLAGDLEQAFAYASEAIEIAEKLGDARLVALNRINLGNVLRDQERPKQAVKEYLEACKVGAEVGDRHLEVQASRLTSAAFLDSGDPQAALSSAQYAVARIDGTTAVEASIDALEQLGDVQTDLRDHQAAAEAYGQAFEKSRSSGVPDSRLLFLHLSASTEAKEYMKAVLRLLEQAGSPIVEATDNVRVILEGYRLLLQLSGGGNLLELTELHLILPSERLDSGSLRILFDRLLAIASSADGDLLRAMAMLSLFVTFPLGQLAMRPIVEASEMVSSHVRELSFRPHPDGAAQWVVSLLKGHPLLVSVTVLDDRPSSGLLAVAFVLFLWRFETELKEELLAGIETPKQEVHFIITHVDELPSDIRVAVPDSERGVSVSRVGKPETDDRTPTMVFYDDTLLKSFRFATGETSGLLVLLLLTLTELCHQLFLGQVDEAQLKPKLVKLLRRAFR
jgi:tetratricopeptide (TPR) repeat protein